MTLTAERRGQFYKSFEAKALKGRPILIRFSDDLTSIFSSPVFLVLNGIFFVIWIGINLGWAGSIKPFDPFPFGFLTMIVSLEAIFLSIFVLVSQNRSSYVDSLREELHLQVNLIAEEEITKVLKVLAEIGEKVGINEKDEELKKMLGRINTNYIEKSLVEQMTQANKPVARELIRSLAKDFPDIINPTTSFSKVVDAINSSRERNSKD